MTDERFDFNNALKKKLIIIGLVGVVLFVIGVISVMSGGNHDVASHGADAAGHAAEAAGHGAEAGGHEAGGAEHGAGWLKRIYANLWINNVYFAGIALIGVFFVAYNTWHKQAGLHQ